MILSSLLVFSACPGKNDSNNAANVVGPQGRIMSLSSENTYCDINAGTIKCASYDPQSNAPCNTSQKVYNQQDMGSFCQKMNELKQESTGGYSGNGYGYANRCDASAAIDRILNEHCKGIATPGVPGNPGPGYPNPNPGYPNPGCQGQNYGCQPNHPAPAIGFINCDIQINNEMPLRYPLIAGGGISKAKYRVANGLFSMLGIFGKKPTYDISMKYMPSGLKGRESVEIQVEHNEKHRAVLVNYVGFAGQPVRVDTVDNGNSIFVSCVDARNARNNANAAQAQEKNLVCHGFSDTLSGGRQAIDVNLPLNQINDGQDISASNAVRITVDKSKSSITYKSLLDTFGPDVNASSSLRSSAMNAKEGEPGKRALNKVEVECGLK